MKVCKELDFSDLMRECWSGAIDTLETIAEHDKEDALMMLLEEIYCDEVPTMTEINDNLRFDDEYLFDSLGIDLEDDEDDD